MFQQIVPLVEEQDDGTGDLGDDASKARLAVEEGNASGRFAVNPERHRGMQIGLSHPEECPIDSGVFGGSRAVILSTNKSY